jgi:hypothetical protein
MFGCRVLREHRSQPEPRVNRMAQPGDETAAVSQFRLRGGFSTAYFKRCLQNCILLRTIWDRALSGPRIASRERENFLKLFCDVLPGVVTHGDLRCLTQLFPQIGRQANSFDRIR